MPEIVSLFPELDEGVPDKDDLDSTAQAMKHRQYALAAEYMVAAEFSLMGYTVTMTGECERYDLVVGSQGGLFRAEVKCNMAARPRLNYVADTKLGYIVRNDSRNKPVERRYLGSHCDLFAFVAMDVRRILFIDPFYLQKTSHFMPVSDLNEEKCELSRMVVLKCLGPPPDST